jgi:hypothetical protein
MDATSAKAIGGLRAEVDAIASLVNVLATSSSVADSNERSEVGRAIPLFKTASYRGPKCEHLATPSSSLAVELVLKPGCGRPSSSVHGVA